MWTDINLKKKSLLLKWLKRTTLSVPKNEYYFVFNIIIIIIMATSVLRERFFTNVFAIWPIRPWNKPPLTPVNIKHNYQLSCHNHIKKWSPSQWVKNLEITGVDFFNQFDEKLMQSIQTPKHAPPPIPPSTHLLPHAHINTDTFSHKCVQ